MSSRHRQRYASLALLVLLAAVTRTAEAQVPAPGRGLVPTPLETVRPGWTISPAMEYGWGWDDNVLVVANPDQLVGDQLQIFNPLVEATYHGRLSEFTGRYSGAISLYHDLTTLNSYDQRMSAAFRRSLNPRLGMFLSGGASATPTTELIEFVGVPFTRTGSFIQDIRGGIEAALTPRASLVVAGHLEHVAFDDKGLFAHLLRGGYGSGVRTAFRQRLTSRTAFTADYDLQHAQVGLAHAPFTVHNADGGFERQLTRTIYADGALGISVLGPSVLGPAKAGMNWRAGFIRESRHTHIDARYARMFVPSYGFGGTMQDDDVSGRFVYQISRGFYSRAAASWRRSEPLTESESRIRSRWVDAAFGYATRNGIQFEGFWSTTRQTVNQLLAELGRHQVGFHIIATRPMRIR
jgi:hypothetical protein